MFYYPVIKDRIHQLPFIMLIWNKLDNIVGQYDVDVISQHTIENVNSATITL